MVEDSLKRKRESVEVMLLPEGEISERLLCIPAIRPSIKLVKVRLPKVYIPSMSAALLPLSCRFLLAPTQSKLKSRLESVEALAPELWRRDGVDAEPEVDEYKLPILSAIRDPVEKLPSALGARG